MNNQSFKHFLYSQTTFKIAFLSAVGAEIELSIDFLLLSPGGGGVTLRDEMGLIFPRAVVIYYFRRASE